MLEMTEKPTLLPETQALPEVHTETTRGKILVADDEAPLLRLLEFLLVRQGYTVVTALNGEEALTIARRELPDLIILDIMMPRLDGLEVLARLRRDPQLASVPILVLTARAQEEDRERGTAAGADAYITKPFEPERLSALIAEFLDRRR